MHAAATPGGCDSKTQLTRSIEVCNEVLLQNFQRKRCELMTSWIARHVEALWEASQALRKVEREFGGKNHSPGQHTRRRMSWGYWKGRRLSTDLLDENGRVFHISEDGSEIELKHCASSKTSVKLS